MPFETALPSPCLPHPQALTSALPPAASVASPPLAWPSGATPLPSAPSPPAPLPSFDEECRAQVADNLAKRGIIMHAEALPTS